jgi:hypothetical protein
VLLTTGELDDKSQALPACSSAIFYFIERIVKSMMFSM